MDSSTLYLFDTNVLLALVRGNQLGKYLNYTFNLSDVINKPIISIVSHGELWALANRNKWGDAKRTVLREMLNDLVTLDLSDPSIIESYVVVDAKCLANPKGARVISDNDKWIAASSCAAKAVLLTTDEDFLHLHPDVCFVQFVHPSSKLPETSAATQPPLQ